MINSKYSELELQIRIRLRNTGSDTGTGLTWGINLTKFGCLARLSTNLRQETNAITVLYLHCASDTGFQPLQVNVEAELKDTDDIPVLLEGKK